MTHLNCVWIAVAAFIVATAPIRANAQTCPTNEELASGVRLTRNEPLLTSLFTLSDGMLVVDRSFQQDGLMVEDTTTYAHPLTMTSRASGSDTLDLVYGHDTSMLDAIDQSDVWSSPISIFENGQITQTGNLTLIFIADSIITLNDCRYKIWLLEQVLVLSENGRLTSTRVYAPELGISVGWDLFDPAGTGRSAVDYDQIAAE